MRRKLGDGKKVVRRKRRVVVRLRWIINTHGAVDATNRDRSVATIALSVAAAF
jgi:hypothetical protein